jgi:hypothetical protein
MDERLKLLIEISIPIVVSCAVYIAGSLHRLNLKIAVVIEQVGGHESRINRLENQHDKQGD